MKRSTSIGLLLVAGCGSQRASDEGPVTAAHEGSPLSVDVAASEPGLDEPATPQDELVDAAAASRSCDGRSATMSAAGPSVRARWHWRCAAGAPVLEWWLQAPGSPHPQSNPREIAVSWETWTTLWTEFGALGWNDLYDECDADPHAPGVSHEFEILDGGMNRSFSCEGSSLPAPFPSLARTIAAETPEAIDSLAPLTVVASARAAPRPSELVDGQIGDCDGMEVRWEKSEQYSHSQAVIHCYGDRPVYWETHAGLPGREKPSPRVRITEEAWARLWSKLASLDWRHLSSHCPPLAPDDEQASRTAGIKLSITDQHGSRTFSCHGRRTLPEPHASLLEALEAVNR